VILILLILLFFWPASAEDEEWTNLFRPPSDEEMKLAFEQVDGVLKQGDFDSAARLLALILEHSQKKDALVEDGEFFVPVHIAVSKRLEKLPKEALDVFALSVEPQARRALERASGSKSLIEIIRSYPLSKAAGEAAILLLDYSLERADITTAMFALSFIKKRESSLSPMLQLKLAVCEAMRGEPSTLKKILSEQPTNNKDLLTRFADSITSTPFQEDRLNTYPFTALSLSFEDTLKLLETPSVSSIIKTQSDGRQQVFPLLLKGSVYISNISALSIFDSEGKPIGERRFSTEESPAKEACKIPAALATDGRLLFGTFWSDKDKGAQLYALTLKGETVWTTGETFDPFLRKIRLLSAPLFVNGLLVVAGYIKERADCQMYLLAFTPEGSFVWWTYLGTPKLEVPAAIPALRGVRRQFDVAEYIQPVSLAAAVDKIIFCTNSGAIGAVEPASGSIEWIYLYPIQCERKTSSLPPLTIFEDEGTPPVLNPILVSETVYKEKKYTALFIAPIDSNVTISIDVQNRRARVLPRYHRAFITLMNDKNLVVLDEDESRRRLTLIYPPTLRVIYQTMLDGRFVSYPVPLEDGLLIPLESTAVLLTYDSNKRTITSQKTVELPKLQAERKEGRFFQRTIPAVYASGLFFCVKDNVFVLHPSGSLAILKRK